MPTPAEQEPAPLLATYAYHLLALAFWLGNLGYTFVASRPNVLLQFGLIAAGYYANKMRPKGKLPPAVSNWEKAFRVGYVLVFIANLVAAGLLLSVFLLVLTKS
jgi:hypothetical protein